MKKILKIKDCDKNLLQTMIKQMVVVDKFVNIRITKDFVDANSYLADHDLIKYMKIDNSKLFNGDYELDKPIRMSFIMGSKLLMLLSQFENDNMIDLEITYDSNSDSDEYYALKITMIGNSLNISEFCADQRFQDLCSAPIPDSIMNKFLDLTCQKLEFMIDKENMKAIKSLSNIERDNKRFEYVIKDSVVSIRERNDLEDEESVIYTKTLANVDSYDNIYICNKNVFEKINNIADYEVHICESQDSSRAIYIHAEDGITLNIITSI